MKNSGKTRMSKAVKDAIDDDDLLAAHHGEMYRKKIAKHQCQVNEHAKKLFAALDELLLLDLPRVYSVRWADAYKRTLGSFEEMKFAQERLNEIVTRRETNDDACAAR